MGDMLESGAIPYRASLPPGLTGADLDWPFPGDRREVEAVGESCGSGGFIGDDGGSEL